MPVSDPGAPGRKSILTLPVILAAILAGGVIGLAAYTFYYAQGLSYLSNRPEACANCHIMNAQYQSWGVSSHHAVAVCNDCHLPHDIAGKYLTKAENGFHHSAAFTLQNFTEPITARPVSRAIVLANCVRCHGDLTENIRCTAAGPGEDVDCIRCHRAAGHGAAQ